MFCFFFSFFFFRFNFCIQDRIQRDWFSQKGKNKTWLENFYFPRKKKIDHRGFGTLKHPLFMKYEQMPPHDKRMYPTAHLKTNIIIPMKEKFLVAHHSLPKFKK